MTSNEIFQPGRLRLARDLGGLTQVELSSLAGITPAAISLFESGDAKPTADTLDALARALEIPPKFFTLPMHDAHEGFFRSLRKSTVTQRRHARSVAHLVNDLAVGDAGASTLAPLFVPSYPVDPLDVDTPDVAKAARSVRSAWGIASGPIPDVVSVLEDHGILVVRLPLGAAEVDAFSLPFPDRPVVVLGTDKADRARSRFDAAHELGHLVIHGESVWGLKEVELQAHGFAAEFLMPAEEIGDRLPASADWTLLFELKREWHVSIAALLKRAKDLEVMSESNYTSAMKGISARGWRRREPIPLGPPEGPQRTTELLHVAQTHASWFPTALLPALKHAVQAGEPPADHYR